MGIAGNIAWIIIGVVYVIYRCFKDSPAETTMIVGACAITIVAITGWQLIFNFLLGLGEIGGLFAIIWLLATIGVFAYFSLKFRKEREAKRIQAQKFLDDKYEKF